MGTWIRTNWWLVLAAVAATVQVVIGIGLPLEDGTAGALAGGIGHVVAGAAVVAGMVVRRRRPRTGDLLIGLGVLPLLMWFWTIVLPVLALAVAIPALLDSARSPEAATDVPARAAQP